MKRGLLIIILSLNLSFLYAAENPDENKDMNRIQLILYKAAPLEYIDSNKGLEFLTGFPAGAGNAADEYATLEMLFEQDRVSKDSYEIKKGSKGLNAILKAISKKDCSLSPQYYPAMSAGTVKQPDIVVYLAYSKAMLDLAKEYENKGDLKHADAIYRCALIFGWHLTQNPPSLLVQMLGVRIKAQATKSYAAFLQRKLDIRRSEKALEYMAHLSEVQKRMGRKSKYFLGNVSNFTSLYSSEKIAKEDEDPVWRQEAILRLGVLRHGVPGSDGTIIATDPKNQKVAEQALMWIGENAKSESERALALWSIKQLTPENFMKIGKSTSQVASGQ